MKIIASIAPEAVEERSRIHCSLSVPSFLFASSARLQVNADGVRRCPRAALLREPIGTLRIGDARRAEELEGLLPDPPGRVGISSQGEEHPGALLEAFPGVPG